MAIFPSEVGKVEGLTWHGDYICLKADIKKHGKAENLS